MGGRRLGAPEDVEDRRLALGLRRGHLRADRRGDPGRDRGRAENCRGFIVALRGFPQAGLHVERGCSSGCLGVRLAYAVHTTAVSLACGTYADTIIFFLNRWHSRARISEFESG